MTPQRRRLLLVATPLVVVLLVVGFVLFRPDTLFFDDVVDEQLDADVAALLATPSPTATTPTPAPTPRASPEPTATAAPTTAPTRVPAVAPTPSAPGATPAAASTPTPEPVPEPAGPVVLARGEWVSLEHTTTGTVALVDDDGDLQVVLADLDGSNGPDLRVILSPKAAVAGDWFGYEDGAVYLGALKGNKGTQTYDVPDDVDLDAIASVVIWCERFSVGFAAADLA